MNPGACPSNVPARRRALSLIEVLVALLAVAVAVVPLLQSGSSIHRQSYMGELHVLAAMRARTLLGVLATMDFDVLHHMLGRANQPAPVPINIETLLPPGELSLMFSAPANVDSSYANKLKLLTHDVTGQVLDRHRIQINVVVKYTLVSDKDNRTHEHRASAILHRPEVTGSLGVATP